MLSSLLNYFRFALRGDLKAGLTVTMLAIPQAAAYALIAGLPVSAGLLSAIFASAIAGLASSSRHLIIGPTNAVALLIQTGTAVILQRDYGHLDPEALRLAALKVVSVISLLAGAIQFVAYLLRLGRFTQYVAAPVMVGYIGGVACALFVNQLFPFLGIAPWRGEHSLIERGIYLVQHANIVHDASCAFGVLCVIVFVLMQAVLPRWPNALLMLLMAAAFCSYAPMDLVYVGDIGSLTWTLQLPELSWPLVQEMLPISMAIALLGMMEGTTVSKTVAGLSGQYVDANRDVLGVGLANTFQAFIGGMPASGSPSRSILNFSSGGKTRMAAVFGGLGVLSALLWGGHILSHIPLTALAALLIVTSVTSMVDRSQLLLCLSATKTDAMVVVLTFLSAWIFRLDTAFYIGLCLSVALSLYKMGRWPNQAETPHVTEKDHHEMGIRTVKVRGDLALGAANHLPQVLLEIAKEKQTRVIILGMQDAHHADATACLAFQQAHARVIESGVHLIGAGINSKVGGVFHNAGITESWGRQNLFHFDEEAVERAMKLLVDDSKEQDRT